MWCDFLLVSSLVKRERLGTETYRISSAWASVMVNDAAMISLQSAIVAVPPPKKRVK